MKARSLALAGAVVACLAACQTVTAPPPTKETSQWWAHVAFLASDKLEGRLTGSEGYATAAHYVADSFKQFGLEPAGADGYFQPVSYEVQTVQTEQSSVSLRDSHGQIRPFALGDDMVLSAGAEQLAQLPDAPLVFIGYGLHLPEAGLDDFADIDLRGKIAVYITGAPRSVPGPLQAYGRAPPRPACS
jgi:hypothetical protein